MIALFTLHLFRLRTRARTENTFNNPTISFVRSAFRMSNHGFGASSTILRAGASSYHALTPIQLNNQLRSRSYKNNSEYLKPIASLPSGSILYIFFIYFYSSFTIITSVVALLFPGIARAHTHTPQVLLSDCSVCSLHSYSHILISVYILPYPLLTCPNSSDYVTACVCVCVRVTICTENGKKLQEKCPPLHVHRGASHLHTTQPDQHNLLLQLQYAFDFYLVFRQRVLARERERECK